MATHRRARASSGAARISARSRSASGPISLSFDSTILRSCPARPEAIVSHLAYSASDEAIDSVFVEGAAVVRGRTLVRGDWNALRTKAENAAEALWAGRGK